MRPKKQPAIPGQRDAGQNRTTKFLNQPDLTPGVLEKAIKSWAIDKFAEAYFYGANSLEHRWAKRFWEKSGRRLRSI